MLNAIKSVVLAAIIAMGVGGVAAADPFNDAEAAYIRRDYATAMRLLRPLADQGDPFAQFKLGIMYDLGRGVTQDYAAAVKWFGLAADQGDPFAQSSLGFMYGLGRGVTQDYAAAVKWYRMAADHGDPDAQNNLGAMHAEGKGVTQDYVQAHKWFNLAATTGDADAVKARDMVAAKMTPAQIAEAQKLAREWKPTK